MENIHVVPKGVSSEIQTYIFVIQLDNLRTHNDFPQPTGEENLQNVLTEY